MASLFTSASIADSNEARVSEIVNSTKGEREREREINGSFIYFIKRYQSIRGIMRN